jgi:hypothetical protein
MTVSIAFPIRPANSTHDSPPGNLTSTSPPHHCLRTDRYRNHASSSLRPSSSPTFSSQSSSSSHPRGSSNTAPTISAVCRARRIGEHTRTSGRGSDRHESNLQVDEPGLDPESSGHHQRHGAKAFSKCWPRSRRAWPTPKSRQRIVMLTTYPRIVSVFGPKFEFKARRSTLDLPIALAHVTG